LNFSIKPWIYAALCTAVSLLVPSLHLPEAHAQHSPATSSESFQVGQIKQIRKGVDLWPLIINPQNLPEQHVDESLTRSNQRLAQSLRECNSDYLKWLKIVRGNSTQKTGYWSRKVRVTMAGPRYFSLVMSQEVVCGGAHPAQDQAAMAFDITTGNLVNWPALVSNSAHATSYPDTDYEGNTVTGVILPSLEKIAVDSAETECKHAFQHPLPFLLWPNAEKETLVARPFGPHTLFRRVQVQFI